MKYGYFDDDRREYVITQPDTPLPWMNYLGCQAYFGIISNTAGGYSFYRDARLRRLTRYRYNNVPMDLGGRYIYLRDDASGEFWSPSWQPTRHELKDYSCRHGMGYTTIGSTYGGIEAETRYFVPLDENLEIWQLTVTNTARQARRSFRRSPPSSSACGTRRTTPPTFSATSIPARWRWRTALSITRRNTASAAITSPTLPARSRARGSTRSARHFWAAYRGWDKPAAVEAGQLTNSIAHGWSPMGAHQVKFDLGPGETRQFVFLLGYHENPEDEKFDPPGSQTINKKTIKPVIAKYLDRHRADAAFERLRKYWESVLGIFEVDTPDVHTNRMVNIWNAYQCMATFNMSRSASFYESGIGRGLGFRDSNQDLLGFVHMVPARARERILDLAATQLPTGGAYHQYQPLTKRGNNDIGGGFNDDPHWLIIGVSAYLKETGDWSILDEPVPFDNEPGSEAPLYEHLRRSFNYTLDRLGPHGLPLIGRADWNDCLNLNCFSATPGQSFQTTTNKDGKVAESVFIAGLFVHAAQELAAIAGRRGLQPEAERCLGEAAKMEQAIARHGWDGEWFLRAYDDFGAPIGSKQCEEGKIFIESNGYCVLAGIGLEDDRAAKAMDAVSQHLATKHGIVVQQPAYSRYYLNLGEISSYPPGYKENAGIFCHVNPWVMIAETRLGHGDQAHDYYTRINPSAREEISELHRCEPYVYAQMIAGKDAPTFGEAKNSWLTGTAAWNYFAITQWILGIRVAYDGLEIAPVIPQNWPGFTARRIFRGVVYNIAIERKGDGNRIALIVDGTAVEGNLVLPPVDGRTVVSVTGFLS